jgi:tetraacyldisaccharide 4'-kinase
VPVIIIGNISVGGTGKTPLVIWLVKCLQQAGYRPGIVSRGYRGKARHWPQQVRADSDPVMVGDEAVLLAQRCQCPVAVDPHRVAAAQALLKYTDCDVIVADDGLQHYALGRDIEIAVIDGVRRFGNGRCLPAGPLREPVARLKTVDFIIVNGGCTLDKEYRMDLRVEQICRVNDPDQVIEIDTLCGTAVHAVAGIGHPQRFFDQLQAMGFDIITHAYPDHHLFSATDLDFADRLPVIMTEKDAVKCRHFASDRCWTLPVKADVDKQVAIELLARLKPMVKQDSETL